MTKFKPIPPVEFLRSRYSYDPATGVLTSHHTGKPIRTKRQVYFIVRIDKTEFRASRVIWKMMTGNDPSDDIDHDNLDRTDNRFGNLREATRRQNVTNKRVRSDSSSGLKGVLYRPARYGRAERWETYIQVNGRRIYLGSSKSAIEAHAKYRSAALAHFGPFARY